MGRTSPCIGRGDRCYGANALRSAAFGGCVFTSPQDTSNPHQHCRTTWNGGPATAFPHLWTVLWTGISAGEAYTLVVSEERLWNSCVGVLRTRLPEAAWQSCFGVARPVALEGSCLVLSVPSVLARQ